MSGRPAPLTRDDFLVFDRITTRWHDNDAYGHINNVVYYAFFDTAVNRHLVKGGVLDIATSPVVAHVAETGCHFFRALSYPQDVIAGLRVTHLGSSSVRYLIGLFSEDRPDAAAQGHFVHVHVDRATGRPVPMPGPVRTLLTGLFRPLDEALP